MEAVKLEHTFLFRGSQDRQELLDKCVLLNTFCGRIEKLSTKSMDENKYKGDALELFTECLIKLSPIDKRIGIEKYRPVIDDIDTGVDGFGIGINGYPATVQVKYRQSNYVLTANNDHLSNYTSASWMKYGVRTADNDNLLIVTTGMKLHHFTDNEMFDGKVRVLNRELLRQLVDNNIFFWNAFRVLWDEAIANNKRELK